MTKDQTRSIVIFVALTIWLAFATAWMLYCVEHGEFHLGWPSY